MTPQESDLITTLLARLKNAAQTAQAKDPEADALIRQAMAQMPDMPYYLVQTVVIQDLALHQAQNHIAELERQLAASNAQKSSGTSFLGGLFGHRDAPPPAPVQQPGGAGGPWSRGPQVAPPQPGPGYGQGGSAPQPGYGQPGYGQPGYGQPGYGAGAGMLGGSGGGFLRSAAATAAGVAGGALLFQGISSLFGHSYASGLGGGMGYSPGLGETVINNYYGDEASGGDYGGGGDAAAGGDYGGGGDLGGGGDFGGGDDSGGGDFGGGGDTSC